MFDCVFNISSQAITHLSEADERLAKVILQCGPLQYNLSKNPYIFLVETIISQMLSSNVSELIARRLDALCSYEITPKRILEHSIHDLRSIGISMQKAEYILTLSDYITKHQDYFIQMDNMDDAKIIKELTKHKGIGIWSAKMYLIFVLNRMDVLPFEDNAFLQAFRWLYEVDITDRAMIINQCSSWSPFSSIAARYLYQLIDNGYTKMNLF